MLLFVNENVYDLAGIHWVPEKETLGIAAPGFLLAICFSRHPTNIVNH